MKRTWLVVAVFAALIFALAPRPARAAQDGGDLICETTTTTGTGTVDLAGAATNYATFASQITSGATVNYHIRASDGKLETGVGTFTDAAPDTLSRTAYWSSDGDGAELTLPAGTHTVCLGPTTQMFAGMKGFQLYSADPGAVGGVLPFWHDSATPADGDIAADIQVYAGDDDEEVGRIALEVDDGATTTEDTQWRFFNDIGGTSAQQMAVGNGVIIGSGTTFPGANGDLIVHRIYGASLTSGLTFKTQTGTADPYLQVGETFGGAGAGFGRFENNAIGPRIGYGKSRAGTIGTYTVVQNNDSLGEFLFNGADGTDFALGARFYARVDGTPGSDDMPSAIVFATSPDGTQSTVDRLTILSDGGIIIGNGTTTPGAEDLSIEGGDIEFGNAGTAGTDTTLSRSAAGELTLEGDAVKHAGKQMFWVPASAMRNSALNPASCGDTYDSGGNDITITVCAFDTGATEENAEFGFAMPKSSNESTITMQFAWTNTGGSAAQTVQWKIACIGRSDDDGLNQAYPADVTVSDTFLAQNDYHLTAETSAITIALLEEGDYVNCRIGRDTSVDDMSGDALLIGAKVYWTDNASTMAE